MALSNMMKHYLTVKERYPDCIIFYRLGDFYEMFFEDAVEASKVLDLTLTGRDCGLEERAPMCGVPFHASEGYIAKLVENGYKVAICEQLTDAKPGKELVVRDVVRVVTPGIVMDETMLDKEKNNYITAINIKKGQEINVGVAYCDVSTGEFVFEELEGEEGSILEQLDGVLTRISPSEIICNEDEINLLENLIICKTKSIGYIGKYLNEIYSKEKTEELLKGQFGEECFENGLKKGSNGAFVSGVLVDYLRSTQKRGLEHINEIKHAAEKYIMHFQLFLQ